jgi:hypothetical protein
LDVPAREDKEDHLILTLSFWLPDAKPDVGAGNDAREDSYKTHSYKHMHSIDIHT